MAKMKSHSGCKKRFKKTASGEIKYSKSGKRHHAWAKDRKRIRNLGKSAYLQGQDHLNIIKLMPY
jgi:large subunit ribosomal protein L35